MKTVSPTSFIRVVATSKGVFNGVAGDIIVCDPEGDDPRARYPRIMAQDARAGIVAGFISLDVDKKKFAASEKEGDRSVMAQAQRENEISSTDMQALADLDAAMRGDPMAPDVIARPVSQVVDDVSIGSAIVEDDDDGTRSDNGVPPYLQREGQEGEGGAGEGAGEGGDGIGAKHTGGGNYDVAAPWLKEPLKVRGKEEAEKEIKRLRDEGAPPQE